MIIRRFVSPVLASNCYVFFEPSIRQAVVVDPGAHTADAVRQWLADHDGTCSVVLLTHGHPDHMWDAGRISSDCPVIVPAPDRYRFEADNFALPAELDFPVLAGYDFVPPTTLRDVPTELCHGEGAEIIPGIALRALPAPGHTEGSMVFLVMADLDDELASYVTTGTLGTDIGARQLVMLSGDVLFAGAMGRTDLPGGDHEEMMSSLRTLRTVIDPAALVLPGHGPASTMAHELATNPFLQFGSR